MKKAVIEQMIEKFTKMTKEDKDFTTGYVDGKEEESRNGKKVRQHKKNTCSA